MESETDGDKDEKENGYKWKERNGQLKKKAEVREVREEEKNTIE